MIIHEVEQGTDEWFAIRAGKPTASEFNKILTASGKKSDQASGYMNGLIAEILAGGNVSDFQGNAWTDRGHEYEDEAATMFGLLHDVEPVKVGFITDDNERYGCSPDRLVSDAGLEIKCPGGKALVGYLLQQKVPSAYAVQVQGSLMVTGFDKWHFIAYHPKIEPLVLEVGRDEEFIKLLEDALEEFLEKMQGKMEKLRSLGVANA